MKNIHVVFFVFCFGFSLNAQIINFPDPVFKQRLVTGDYMSATGYDVNNHQIPIDANHDGEVEISEAEQIYQLNLPVLTYPLINNVEGIKYFTNLHKFTCEFNAITSLDVSNMANLTLLVCGSNPLTSLNVSGCSNLNDLDINVSELSSLDASGLTNLRFLTLGNCTLLTSVNLSNCSSLFNLAIDYTSIIAVDASESPLLGYLYATHCPQLTTIFAKNGSDESYGFDFSNSPNVNYICVDDSQITAVQNLATQYGNTNCVVNSYCSFTPGGNYFTIQGNSTFDADNDGCGGSDPVFEGLKLSYATAGVNGNITTGTLGSYHLDFPGGSYTITPVLENPTYFAVSPTTLSVTYPGQSSPLLQNFCVAPNGTHNDLEVTIIPLTVARPGFNAQYKIIYKNKGTHTRSGNITLAFQDDRMDYITSSPVYTSQSTNLLSWDYAALLPFESREITVDFNLNSPIETPAVNSGDQLDFAAVVYPIVGDQITADNTSPLKQTVVASFDPNDKTCIEGTLVSTTVVGNYVHYLIRFENTGNSAAENIVVKDIIDTNKFDVSSLVTVSSSNHMVSRFTSPNKVEFIFENINLPFDDAHNDGYVAFKIKTKPNLVVGNSFSNSANIYFDYNAAIVTNTATSTIQALTNADFEFSDYFSLFPNPAKNVLNIQAKNSIEIGSVSIYNALGQLVISIPDASEVIDISTLRAGTYFIKINSDKGTTNTKFISE